MGTVFAPCEEVERIRCTILEMRCTRNMESLAKPRIKLAHPWKRGLKMLETEKAILTRAAAIMASTNFGAITQSTAAEYRLVAARVAVERAAAGSTWTGPATTARTKATASVRRAAWSRRVHVEVASAYRDLVERRIPAADAIGRLESWVPEAEVYRPSPPRDLDGVTNGRPVVVSRPSRSKRAKLRELPSGWMDKLWDSTVDRECRHLDAIAVLLVTGCRPQEVVWGVAVRRVTAGLQVAIAGAKVRPGAGQPWRLLTVALDVAGPAAHLGSLVDVAPKGLARIKARCSPNALSMAVTDISADCVPGRRLSAYDVRHQRAADARTAFGGDLERLAAWLGHAGTETVRYYGRLPRAAGVRGALPLAVAVARPVLVRDHRAAPALKMSVLTC